MSESWLAPEVLAYYERGGEATRLGDTPQGRLEFLRTQDILRRVLPEPPAWILDVGGGQGVHARWLTADGHRVRLVDPVPSHVDAAAGITGVDADLGDARDLSVVDDSYDVTLLLGPLYHLLDATHRLTALREARRVTKPGGLVAAATISRFSGWLDAARHHRLANRAWLGPALERLHDTGELREWERDVFTTAYMHRPEEIHAEAVEAGLVDIRQTGVEGPVWLMTDIGPDLEDPASLIAIMDGLRRFENEPSLLGVSGHLLTIARVG